MFIPPHLATAFALVHFRAFSHVETIVVTPSGSLSAQVCPPPTASAHLPCCSPSGPSGHVAPLLHAPCLLQDQGQTS